MRVVGDGKVWLQKGEAVPVFCACGAIYQPALGAESSICPECSYENHFDKGPRWDLIAEMPDAFLARACLEEREA